MYTFRKSGRLTLIDSSFAWLGEDGGYRVAGADVLLLAHLLFCAKEKAYNVLGYENLRLVERYCKKNGIDFTHGMVAVKEIQQDGDFLKGSAEVESRSKSKVPVYNVDFGGLIKKTDDANIRRLSLKKFYVNCECKRASSLLKKVVKRDVRNMYNDNRNPNDCVVTVSTCFHSALLMYELGAYQGIDGYDQIGLRTQTNFFAIHELRKLLDSRTHNFEINYFHLRTNFFNPLRKILGIPLVV